MNCPECQTPIDPSQTKITITPPEPGTVKVNLYCLKCARFVLYGAVSTLSPVLNNGARAIARITATSKKGT